MAHGDYHCCAVCDRKMDYSGWEARTKEDICHGCLSAMRDAGFDPLPLNSEELVAWIEANPSQALVSLTGVGFRTCFYPNPVDEAWNAAKETTP